MDFSAFTESQILDIEEFALSYSKSYLGDISLYDTQTLAADMEVHERDIISFLEIFTFPSGEIEKDIAIAKQVRINEQVIIAYQEELVRRIKQEAFACVNVLDEGLRQQELTSRKALA